MIGLRMLDWDDLRVFLAVQRAGTLARAAAELSVNPTTVGRRVAALEEKLSVRLFDRRAEGWLPTSAARDLVAHAEQMEREAIAVEREIAGADLKLAGTVRVTATEMLVTRFISRALPGFAARYPELTLDFHCSNRVVSLTRREADIALRLARPREDDVVTRKIATIELALYASHAYLQARGAPERPDESLSGHDVLRFAETRTFELENAWLEPRLGGARVAMRSDSVSSLYGAVVAGLGIALLPRAVADTDRELERIVTASFPEPRVVWQTVHRDLKDTPRIRAVLEFLTEVLSAEPAVVTPSRR
jgi:DNA-binding transcriptional LysR family regulator